MLIVVSGLPGVGKTSLARSVAADVQAVHLSVDVVEDALLSAGLPAGWTTGVAAYEAVAAVAVQNLALGAVVVADAVNDSDAARETWRKAAARAGCELRFVVILPPPPDEHRRRLRERRRGLQLVAEPTWSAVVERAANYAPWTDPIQELDGRAPLPSLTAAVVATL